MNYKYKVWLELSSRALKYNVRKLKSLILPATKIFAVVKSNAYGHGLLIFSQMADKLGVDGFCVDSVVEGKKLRENKITKPIIILGMSLPSQLLIAEENDLIITVSTWSLLYFLAKNYPQLPFHLKIDTGMHRQGFYVEGLALVAKFIKEKTLNLKGMYSHLATASNKSFSKGQRQKFIQAINILEQYDFKHLTKHLSATGGALLGRDFHFDLVRTGMGLYGCWPGFQPVLSWYSFISEIKILKRGDYVGYDKTELIKKPTTVAIIPIGYWHGFDRGLSGIGEVMIKNKSARVLGRVSMDMIVVDVSKINCQEGDQVTILGDAIAMGKKINTSPYEIVTRINPLIKKIVV